MCNYVDEFISKNGIKNLLDVFHHGLTRLKYMQDHYKPSYDHITSLLCSQVEQVASILFHIWSYHPVRYSFIILFRLTDRFHFHISPTLELKLPSFPHSQPHSSHVFSPAVIYSYYTQFCKISITHKHQTQCKHLPFFTPSLLLSPPLSSPLSLYHLC